MWGLAERGTSTPATAAASIHAWHQQHQQHGAGGEPGPGVTAFVPAAKGSLPAGAATAAVGRQLTSRRSVGSVAGKSRIMMLRIARSAQITAPARLLPFLTRRRPTAKIANIARVTYSVARTGGSREAPNLSFFSLLLPSSLFHRPSFLPFVSTSCHVTALQYSWGL